MADNVQLQGIEFEIVGESEKAAGGIKTLTSSLKKLQAVAGKGLGLEKIKNEIKDLNETIGNIQDGGLIGLANSLGNIANASRKLGNVGEKLKNISELDFSNLQTAAQAIGAIADTAGWRRGGSGGSGNGGNSIPTDLPTDTPESEQVDGSSQAVENVANAQERAASSGKALRQVLVNLAKEFGKGAVKAGKFAVKLAALPFKKLADTIKSTLAPLKSFMSSIARIAMYRAIRGLISGITQSLKEGIKNLYEFSKAAGTTFHTAMDSMAADAQWLKNSLAAAVAPIIETLMPAIDALAAKIAHVLDLLAQLFAMLSGRSTYTKAIKSAKEYGEATGGAAKELRMLISGFDELNVFSEASSGGGGGADVGDMFEEEELPINDFLQKLKDAIDKGDWEGLGRLLGEKVNEIFANIDWAGIGSKLGKAIDAVIRTAYSFLKTVDFKAIGADIATLINNAIYEINFDTAGRLFVRKITALLDFIIGFIMTLDWGAVAKAIGDFFKGAFAEATEWLNENNFAEIGEKVGNGILKILDAMLEAVKTAPWEEIGRAIGEFLGGIPWKEILEDVAEIVWTAFKGVLDGLLSTEDGRIFVALVAGIGGLKLAWAVTKDGFKKAIDDWVANGLKSVKSMPDEVAAAGNSTKSVLDGIAKTIKTAALGVFDAVMIAYDVKSIVDASRTYNDAQLAHNHETETALNSYSQLYQEKGKEVADEWAKMVYEIDTTNMNFDQAQQALTEKIEGYWDGVPQNMWEGFKQGWNSYFGEGGSGLLGLLNDAFTGAVDGIKSLLGIHSPSTVFFDMGVDLVTGLFNGISSVWNTVTTFFTQSFTELKTIVQQTWTSIQQFTTQTWTTITQFTTQTWTNIKTTMTTLFTEAGNNIKAGLENVKQNVTTVWDNVKQTTATAWSSMVSTATQKFTEIKNTVVNMMTTATNHIRNTNWYSLGVNLMQGFLNGLQSLMSTIWNSVVSFVQRCTAAVRSALGIHSPSTVWEEIGIMLDLGLQKGLEGGANKLMTTAGKLSESLTGAMNPTLPSPSDMAAGMSYGVKTRAVGGNYAGYAEDEESMSGIMSVLEQMFDFMRTAEQGDNRETKIIIDGREVFNAVVKENNRAIQRTGASPIRV